ncbi:hypothetical protein CHRY9390_02519 [Chryseobacterium aquaeductus]|uniref:DUF5362 domain-containing protein n=1 Tax=Chryseobacterium aquaeductus TaxID=2675056 RepID=A0A9N8MIJ0_9FLAO|nr:DUF5362 family protein [Chryseobacterium aquaeductus]CAA7331803.1 hypothetical protein CHRY9390_02519 [Chryseobacterium potabilaquae]CAD7812481.1 hypothetical protein CHRY9390_02519 [Chryseobacterium aquaeductus]
METKSPFEQFDELRIDSAGKLFLKETAKWTAFLAILGYIGIGFMVLAALFMMSFGASMSSYKTMMPMGGGAFLAIFYLVFAALYFIPINYLYKFSSNMKLAIQTNNQANLTKSFEYLKSHYKFIGILTIIVFSIYILIFLGAMFMGASSML